MYAKNPDMSKIICTYFFKSGTPSARQRDLHEFQTVEWVLPKTMYASKKPTLCHRGYAGACCSLRFGHARPLYIGLVIRHAPPLNLAAVYRRPQRPIT